MSREREVNVAPFLIEIAPQRTGSYYLPDDFPEGVDPFDLIREGVPQEGFRLPTPDEWEYASAAGSRALFRWGSAAWPDREISQEPGKFDLHRRPNAFGLRFGTNPWLETDHGYGCEVIDSISRFKGGDGGALSQASGGGDWSWAQCMPAYYYDAIDSDYYIDAVVRRVLRPFSS